MALLVMVIHSHGFFLGHKNGMHARIIATAAIYQKVGEWRGGKSSRGGGRGERNEGERRERDGREKRRRKEKVRREREKTNPLQPSCSVRRHQKSMNPHNRG